MGPWGPHRRYPGDLPIRRKSPTTRAEIVGAVVGLALNIVVIVGAVLATLWVLGVWP